MSYFCFKCSSEIIHSPGAVVGRRDECAKCRSDIHVCRNCKHYDKASYNECRESQAERVLEKDRSNFCDFFALRAGKPGDPSADPAAAAKRKLDDLFK